MSQSPEECANDSGAIALPPPQTTTDLDHFLSLDAMKTGLRRWLDAATRTGNGSAARPVTETMVRRKADELAEVLGLVDFGEHLSGWMSRWRWEYGFSSPRRTWNDHGVGRGLADYGAADVYVLFEISFDCPSKSRAAKTAAAETTHERPLRLGVALVCNVAGTDRLRPAAMDNSHDPRSVRDVRVALDAYAGNEWTVWDGYESFFDAWDRAVGRDVLVVLDDRVARPSNADRLRHITITRFPRPRVADDHAAADAANRLTWEILRVVAAYEVRLARVSRPPGVGVVKDDYSRPRPGFLSTLDFMYLIADVWRCAPAPLVRNCFRACGLIRDGGDAEPLPPDTVDADFNRWVTKYRALREQQVLLNNLDVMRNRQLAACLQNGRPGESNDGRGYSCGGGDAPETTSVTAAVSTTNVFGMPATVPDVYDFYFSIMQASAAQRIFGNCGTDLI